MTTLLPSDRDDLQTRFLADSGDLFTDPMSEYFEADYTAAASHKFLPFRPPPAPHVYTPTLSSRSSEATSDAESDEIALPAFETEEIAAPDDQSQPSTPKITAANTATNEGLDPLAALSRTSSDDASIESEPERHVDYLSHDWREEDIWSSWRYVVSRRDRYSNGVRLENASWRTWAKSKYSLRTVSPETLNWLKDCDVTWLYGPLQTDIKSLPAASNSNKPPPPSGLSSTNSFLDRKSILKKKTASEAILQRSLSQHTLLKHAGAILQAQKAEHSRGKPSFERATSDVGAPLDRILDSPYCTPSESASSGLVSPSEKRHIHFNNEVVQCIAVEAKDYYEERDVDPSLFFLGEELDDDYAGFDKDDDDTESDEGIVMMKTSKRSSSSSSSSSLSSSATTPHTSFRSASSESKTIAPLPPTTLKCRSDTPEPIPTPWSPPTELSPTPSVETLRPSRPEANFLLDDDDDDDKEHVDAQWRFDGKGSQKRSSSKAYGTQCYYSSRDRPWFVNPEDREELENSDDSSRGNLHLTPSGMFMPYDEGESYTGVFGRMIDTVNTARDIAHVIWNVGWRK
ncbi:hypothetical protein UA08_06272 [Talaromyces atroroseus]|uniref:Nitrogen regulatory protein areA GATA-like domain-containing protein n=1 Tax=Talaromyces atroroseus TaxID=1441469 RepID=A0A225ABX5_TALAT|nr:hypothetical protein UA08_06272 [Talaromyces atroroseus]OKL58542.1 hypothetical protein UA08_06272 [Talaromyces atroroseus]